MTHAPKTPNHPRRIPDPFRLLNEWRDTAFLVCTVAATLDSPAMIAERGFGVALSPVAFFVVHAVREGVRAAAWAIAPPLTPVGGERPPLSREQAIGTAGFSVMAVNVGASLATLPSLQGPGMGFPLIVALGSSLCAWAISYRLGGFGPIVNGYRVMWDWPRKRDGGGGTETRQLQQSASKLVRALMPLRPRTAQKSVPTSALRRTTGNDLVAGPR